MAMESYQIVAIILVIGIAVIVLTSASALMDAIADFFGDIFKSPYQFEFIGGKAEKQEISEGICLVTANSTMINKGFTLKDVVIEAELHDPTGKMIAYKEYHIGDLAEGESKAVNINFSAGCDRIGEVAIDVLSYEGG